MTEASHASEHETRIQQSARDEPRVGTLDDASALTAPDMGAPLLASAGVQSVQRRTVAEQMGRAAGNQALARMLATNVLQRSPPTQIVPGRGISTRFGDYWVVPNDTRASYDVVGEQVTEAEFAAIEAVWNDVNSGSGDLLISERDSAGGAHAGFRDRVLTHIGRLLSRPAGRQVITGIVRGGRAVTVVPSAARVQGGAETDAGSMPDATQRPTGAAGPGSTATVTLDPNVSDTDVLVHDAAGAEIADPVFIFLGHELIHAQHITLGRVNLGAATGAGYPHAEEESTIATGTPSENSLRLEHGLPRRAGHGGRDRRVP
jgi:hypothetical protein